jgi:hypothetical protein
LERAVFGSPIEGANLARLLELSGTAEWHETVADVAGILVLNPEEFEQAVADLATTPAEPVQPASSVRRAAGRTRNAR